MRRQSPPSIAELVALYDQVAGVLLTSADLADEDARRAERAGDGARAALERARAQRARLAADRGRRIGRRLSLRAQADRLFGRLPSWQALFDGRDTPDGVMVGRLGEAVIGTDLSGTVKLWNRAAERLYGWKRAEVVGRPITDITVGPNDAEVAERIMASVRSTGSWEGEFWVIRRDGTRFLAYVRDVVVADDGGRPLGLVGMSIDLAPGLSDPAPTPPAHAAGS